MTIKMKAIWLAAVFLVASLAFAGVGLAATGELLISLDFEDGLANAGSWGGNAKLIEYARGEGPVLTSGRGIGGSVALDFTRASRSGGLESDPAGGLLSLTHPGKNYPQQFTISLWFQATEPRGFERILDPVTSSKPRLDVYLQMTNRGLFLESRHIHGEPRYTGTTEILGGRWYFLAVVVDGATSTKTIYLGGEDPWEFSKEIEFEHPVSVVMAHDFRLGNIDEIRPFKGYMDQVEVREGALSEGEIRELWMRGRQ